MIEDIRVVEWVEEYTSVSEEGTKVVFSKEKYDIQVKYHGIDKWVPLQRVTKQEAEK